MIARIEIKNKAGIKTPEEVKLIHNLPHLNLKNKPKNIQVKYVYFIEGNLSNNNIYDIARKLLVDVVAQDFFIYEGFHNEYEDDELLVSYKEGVMDPVAISVKRAVIELGFDVKYVRTAKFYKLEGLSADEVDYIGRKLIYNPLIEKSINIVNVKSLGEFEKSDYVFKKIEIDLLNADDDKLIKISKDNTLSLTLEEMRTIKEYFSRKGRNPTDCELETIAQTWSEHCKHKTFRGNISYKEIDEEGNTIKEVEIKDLLKQTIVKATEDIAHKKCVSVFADNAGIVKFTEDKNISFKVETHNHPSSLEPFGGAATGIGGVIRDILGVGNGGYPIANLDVFCFAEPDIPYEELPEGVLHPNRIMHGVVSGVKDYGNKMGIPTVAGAVLFDKRYIGNPLVYAGTLGIMDDKDSFKEVHTGEVIIVLGGKTGKDGIHGATFSSVELDTSSSDESSSSVQIGNPIEEKKVTSALMRALKENLYTAITDCGAGGLSSAVGELTEEHGCEVYLEKVPLKYNGLSYTEIWISESQERMVIITEEDKIGRLKEIFEEEEVDWAVIGRVTDTHRLRLFYKDNEVCNLDMEFLHNGVPKLSKKAVWINKKYTNDKIVDKENYNEDLIRLISTYNIGSKEWIINQYDHEVQGGSVVKPLMGMRRSPEDCSVIKPILGNKKGVIIGTGINPYYSDVDPYWMAGAVIDEAIRNIISMGGDPDNIFILDNFAWGSPDKPENLAGLVRASQACYDFSVKFKTPFISGKDSLYNEYSIGDKSIVIPGTLLISGMGIIDNIESVIPSSFKNRNSLIYLVGITKDELGMSEFVRINNIKNYDIPELDTDNAVNIYKTLSSVMNKGLVVSAHDISEGGMAVAVSEMSFFNNIGFNIDIEPIADISITSLLFSESLSRFIVEVKEDNRKEFESRMNNVPFTLLGRTSEDSKGVFKYGNKELINLSIDELYKKWVGVFNKL